MTTTDHEPIHPRRSRPFGRLVLAGGLLIGGAACGDDADGGADAGSAESGTSTSAAAADLTAYCDSVLELDQAFARLEDFTPEALATVVPLVEATVDVAPAELAEEAPVLLTAIEAAAQGDFSVFEDPNFEAASSTVHTFDVEECGFQPIDIEAVDYGFEAPDLPTEPGRYSLELTNSGEEFHVLGLARLRDDRDGTAQEVFEAATDEAAFEAAFEQIGGIGVGPGDDEFQLVELTAGSYVVFCPIPVGSTADADFEGAGPPHFTQGMVEFVEIG